MFDRTIRLGPVLCLSIMLSLFSIDAVEAIELLVNGNFDSGNVAWVEDSGNPNYNVIVNSTEAPIPPQSGTFLAWLGGFNSVTQTLYQNVVVPPGTASLQVKGFYWITTEETGGQFDHATVALLSSDGSTTLETLRTWSNLNNTSAWMPFAVSTSGNYAGQTVRLQFSTVLDSSLNTNFFFDTIEFIANIPTDVPHLETGRSWASIKSLYR